MEILLVFMVQMLAKHHRRLRQTSMSWVHQDNVLYVKVFHPNPSIQWLYTEAVKYNLNNTTFIPLPFHYSLTLFSIISSHSIGGSSIKNFSFSIQNRKEKSFPSKPFTLYFYKILRSILLQAANTKFYLLEHLIVWHLADLIPASN